MSRAEYGQRVRFANRISSIRAVLAHRAVKVTEVGRYPVPAGSALTYSVIN